LKLLAFHLVRKKIRTVEPHHGHKPMTVHTRKATDTIIGGHKRSGIQVEPERPGGDRDLVRSSRPDEAADRLDPVALARSQNMDW